jgi:hypothetical protein
LWGTAEEESSPLEARPHKAASFYDARVLFYLQTVRPRILRAAMRSSILAPAFAPTIPKILPNPLGYPSHPVGRDDDSGDIEYLRRHHGHRFLESARRRDEGIMDDIIVKE